MSEMCLSLSLSLRDDGDGDDDGCVDEERDLTLSFLTPFLLFLSSSF